jgi:hypothetical protein
VIIGALIGRYQIDVLFTAQPIAIALQLMAVALMCCCEEQLVKQQYPEYAKVTKRMIPYLF